MESLKKYYKLIFSVLIAVVLFIGVYIFADKVFFSGRLSDILGSTSVSDGCSPGYVQDLNDLAAFSYNDQDFTAEKLEKITNFSFKTEKVTVAGDVINNVATPNWALELIKSGDKLSVPEITDNNPVLYAARFDYQLGGNFAGIEKLSMTTSGDEWRFAVGLDKASIFAFKDSEWSVVNESPLKDTVMSLSELNALTETNWQDLFIKNTDSLGKLTVFAIWYPGESLLSGGEISALEFTKLELPEARRIVSITLNNTIEINEFIDFKVHATNTKDPRYLVSVDGTSWLTYAGTTWEAIDTENNYEKAVNLETFKLRAPELYQQFNTYNFKVRLLLPIKSPFFTLGLDTFTQRYVSLYPPKINEVSPSVGIAYRDGGKVTVIGESFCQDDTIKVVLPSTQQTIACNNVEKTLLVDGKQQLQCDLDYSSAPPGEYDLIVNNPLRGSAHKSAAINLTSTVQFDNLNDASGKLIKIGATVNTNKINLGLFSPVNEPANSKVKVEVEAQKIGVAFTNVATTAQEITIIGPRNQFAFKVPLTLEPGSYHWQARYLDSDGKVILDWSSFPGSPENAETDADFIIISASSLSNSWDSFLKNLVVTAHAYGPCSYTNYTVASGITNNFGANSTYNYCNVTVAGTLNIGGNSTLNVEQILTVNNGGIIYINGDTASGKGVTINTDAANIQSGGTINGVGRGYVKATGPGAGSQGDGHGSGGSHGGKGGDSYGYPGGSEYGSASAPITLGSGGGDPNGTAISSGGSALRLNVTTDLTINGGINFNGVNATNGGGPGGGSIWIVTNNLSGTASITAAGGNASGTNGGGGGGRIAVYYNNLISFSPTFSVARGTSTNSANHGVAGTLVYRTLNANKAIDFMPQRDNSNNTIGIGATTTRTVIRFSVWTRSDDTINESQTLQLEIRPIGTGFTGVATHSGPTVSHLTTTPILAVKDVTLTAGSYHWQARFVDSNGNPIRDWGSFPSSPANLETEADFIIGATNITNNNYPDLTINTNWTFPASLTFNYRNLTINSTKALTINGASTLNITGLMTVTGTLNINSNTTTGVGVTINALNLSIPSGGTITGVGRGYLLSTGTGAGSTGSKFSGGGHGGKGGDAEGYPGGNTYGSASAPITSGSGGGGTGVSTGGSALKLTVTNDLTINGTINMSGLNATNAGGPGGGSLWIIAEKLIGTATISAKGGNASGDNGGGGGGRIAVYYNNNDSFIPTFNVSYGTSTNSANNGFAGTLVYKSINSTKVVDFFTQRDTTNNPIGIGATTNQTSIRLSAWTKSDNSTNESQTLQLEIRPVGTAFTGVATHTGPTVTHLTTTPVLAVKDVTLTAGSYHWQARFVDAGSNPTRDWGSFPFSPSNLENEPDFIIGATNITNTNYPDLTIDINWSFPTGYTSYYRNLTVNSVKNLTISGNSIVNITALMTVNGITYINGDTATGKGVTINAIDVNITNTGSINGVGRGYLLSTGPGAGSTGSKSSGGGHGGKGGDAAGYPGGNTYGSATAPITLGSGGGGSTGAISTGGSALKLTVANDLTINGSINMSGINASNATNAGGPAGGSLWIVTHNLTGTATISANGGNAVADHGGGGGGRIAIYYDDNSGFNPTFNYTYGTSTNSANNGEIGTLVYIGTAPAKYYIELPGVTFTDGVGISGTPNDVIAGNSITYNVYAVSDSENISTGYQSTANLIIDANTSEICQLQFVNGVATCTAQITTYLGRTTLSANSTTGPVLTGSTSQLRVLTNLPDPIITNIVPDNANQVAMPLVYIDINGSNLDQNAFIKLTKSGTGDITPLETTFINAQKLRCYFNFTDAVSGLWNVYLENPDTRSYTLASALVIGNITYTNPATSGVNWYQGETRQIAWTSSGNFNYKISYSSDNFVNETIITETTTSANTNWTIPTSLSGEITLRVAAIGYSSIFKDTTVNISVPGSLAITAPTSLETWSKLATRKITWSIVNHSVIVNPFTNLKLSYSQDDFVHETIISSNYNGAGNEFSWAIPGETPSGTIKIRFISNDNLAIFDTRQIVIQDSPGFNVAIPNGGELYRAGNLTKVTWSTSNLVDKVDLYYSLDNFTTSNLIVANLDNVNEYYWRLPEITSTNVKFKVASTLEPIFYDLSDNVFGIVENMVITNPVGGEEYVRGEVFNITWETYGPIPNVRIEISKDNFSTLQVIETSIPNTGSYEWTVPSELFNEPALGDTFKIRIVDVTNSGTYTTSPDNFSIKDIRLVNPVAGSVLKIDDTSALEWLVSSLITVNNVNVGYYIGSEKTTILENEHLEAGINSFNWTVDAPVASDVYMFVEDTLHPFGLPAAVYDTNVVSVSAANKVDGLKINNPSSGEKLVYNETYTINWDTTPYWGEVYVLYSKDNFVNDIHYITATAQGLPRKIVNNGTFNWIIPDDINANIKIKVMCADYFGDYLISQAFNIVGVSTISAPANGATLDYGSVVTVNWSTTGTASNFILEYSTDNFTYINESIASNLPKSGSYNWTIPNQIMDGMKLRIRHATSPDFSNSISVNIKGNINVTSPIQGDEFNVLDTTTITWNTTSGNIAKVDILYSLDNFSTSYPVATNIDNHGFYLWDVDNHVGVGAKVRVQATNAASTNGNSAEFTVYGAINVTSPVVSDVFEVGSIHNISWEALGEFSKVDIYISTDNFATKELITRTNNTGVYQWTVTDKISANARIRVVHPQIDFMYDDSESFKIKGVINFVYPFAGGELVRNQIESIEWQHLGSIGGATLEYSIDAGSSWISIASNIDGLTNIYNWDIPAGLSGQISMRITAGGVVPISHQIDNVTIKDIVVKKPATNERVIATKAYTIDYSVNRNISNVDIFFSTNGGTNYSPLQLALSVSSGTSLNWTVPDLYNTQARIKVASSDTPSNNDASENFAITGAVEITSPYAGATYIIDVNDVVPLKWNLVGSTISSLSLAYSIDNGQNWTNIKTNQTASSLEFNWPVVNTTSEYALLRITSNGQPEVVSFTPTFRITDGIRILYPNFGSAFRVDDSISIEILRHASKTNSFVSLQYSANGISNWHTVGKINANQMDSFAIPNVLNPNALINNFTLRLVNDQGLEYSRVHSMIVRPNFDFTEPTAGMSLQTGGEYEIKWYRTNNAGAIRLFYTVDGVNYTQIGDTNINAIKHTWNLPAENASNANLRACFINELSDCFDSDNFRITGIRIANLNSATRAVAGSRLRLIIDKPDNIDYVSLELSIDNGQNWTPIDGSLNINNTFDWDVPVLKTNEAKIRINGKHNYDGPILISSETSIFKIIGSINVSIDSLNEYGKYFLYGENVGVAINLIATSNVDLYYVTATDAFVSETEIVNGNNVSSHFDWQTGTFLLPHTDFKIKAYDSSDHSVYSYSESFNINKARITNPKADFISGLRTNTNTNITWDFANGVSVDSLKIQICAVNDCQYNTIASGLEGTSTGQSGSFSWNIPTNISGKQKLRLLDTTSSTDGIEIAFSKNFDIKGALHITSDFVSQELDMYDDMDISWTYEGSFSEVNVGYIEAGVYHFIEKVPNNGHYIWQNITIGKGNYQIRLSDPLYDDVEAISSEFLVRGSLSVLTPTSNKQLTPGQEYEITWNTSKGIANVAIAYAIYDTDNAIWFDYQAITTATDNDKSYYWVIPDIDLGSNTKSVRIRISDSATPVTEGISQTFTISQFAFKNDIHNLNPNSAYKMLWYSNGRIDKVNLYYEIKDEAKVLIANDVNNQLFYDGFIVPDRPNTQMRLYIESVSDPQMASYSRYMTVNEQNIAFIKPGGTYNIGEVNPNDYALGQILPITWKTNKGVIHHVTITVSNNGGAYNLLPCSEITGVTCNGEYTSNIDNLEVINWLPTSEYNNAILKIVGDNYAHTISYSAYFNVRQLYLTNIYSDTVLRSGKENLIKWNVADRINDISLYYAVKDVNDEWNDWQLITNSEARINVNENKIVSEYNWAIPESFETIHDVKLRIIEMGNPNVSYTSPAIDILPWLGNVTLSNMTTLAGSSNRINWSSTNGIDNVVISFESLNDNTASMPANINSNNDFNEIWEIPDNLAGQVRIKVTDASEPRTFGYLDIDVAGKEISVTSPDKVLGATSTYLLKWKSSSAIRLVDISYSEDNFATETIVATSIPGSIGQFNIVLPDHNANNFKFKVHDHDAVSYEAITNSQKLARVYIDSPNGGETYIVGDIIPITFFFASSIDSVDITTIKQNGGSEVIAANWQETSLDWDTGTNGGDFKIKINDHANASEEDYSDDYFNISRLKLTVLEDQDTPVSTAQSYNITWRSANDIAFVDVYYSEYADFRSSNKLNTDPVIAMNGSFIWESIPETLLGHKLYLKVVSSTESNVSDTSNYALMPVMILVTSPQPSSGVIRVFSAQAVNWIAPLSIKKFAIVLSNDGFVNSFVYLAQNIDSTNNFNNTATVRMPDEVMSNVKVRVYKENDDGTIDTGVFGETLLPFNLKRVFGIDLDGVNSQYPKITQLNNQYGLTWRDMRDGNSEIYYTLFNASAEQMMQSIRITDDSAESDYPSIANDGGNLMLAWQDRRFNGYSQIMARKIASDGDLIGSEISLTADTADNSAPDLQYASATNTYGLVWYNDISFNRKIYFMSLDANGNPIGSRIALSDGESNAITPAIARNANNNGFYITYSDDKSGRNEIYLLEVSASGSIISGPEKVSNGLGNATFPDLVFGKSLGIVWMDDRDLTTQQIYYAHFDTTTKTFSADKKLTSSNNLAMSPSITYHPYDDCYSLVWVDYRNFGLANLYFSRIDDSGELIDGELKTDNNLSDSTYPFIIPVLDDGQYGLTWNERNDGVYSVKFSILFMGEIMKFDVIAKPEKRITGDFSDSFTLEIRPASVKNPTRTTTVNMNSLGNSINQFKLGNLRQADYDIAIKSDTHLKMLMTNVELRSGVNTLDFTANGTQYLFAGDINGTSGDNVIDYEDLATLDDNFLEDNIKYDLNRDGQINSLDYSVLISNLSKTGDE